jgi:hypothetical protein
MTQITRGWLAFAAIGAAVIHLALVLGSPLALSIVLGLLGAIEFAWGVLTLSRDRILFARAARFGAIAPVLMWSLVVVMATILDAPFVASGINFVPMAIATLFELFIAIVLNVQLRRQPKAITTPRSGRYLLGMFAGALVVAAITAPALAFTQVGISNQSTVRYEFSDPGHVGH